jgi:hypothetical protein
MGCDIHAYIEYEEESDDKQKGKNHVSNFAQVKVNRNYWLFTLMAGVRGNEIQGHKPVSEPKGLPKEVSYTVSKDAFLCVMDIECASRADHCCSREDAERWGSNYIDEAKRYVHHPDLHSNSCLSLQDMNEVIQRYSSLKERHQIWLKPHETVPDGYQLSEEDWAGMKIADSESVPVEVPCEILAIRAAMEVLEKAGKTTRLVFFFDN